jgi:hypothetical protein
LRAPQQTAPCRARRLVGALALTLSALLGASGCRTAAPLPPAGTLPPREPPTPALILEEGDLLLTRFPDAVAAMLARHGATPGPYSHAALYVRDAMNPGVVPLI